MSFVYHRHFVRRGLAKICQQTWLGVTQHCLSLDTKDFIDGPVKIGRHMFYGMRVWVVHLLQSLNQGLHFVHHVVVIAERMDPLYHTIASNSVDGWGS